MTITLRLEVNLGGPVLTEGLGRLLAILSEIKGIVVTNQEKINAIGASLDAATNNIRGDIQRLKDQVANGETLDFGPLDRHLQQLEGLDAENPAPIPPDNPPDGPGPAAKTKK